MSGASARLDAGTVPILTWGSGVQCSQTSRKAAFVNVGGFSLRTADEGSRWTALVSTAPSPSTSAAATALRELFEIALVDPELAEADWTALAELSRRGNVSEAP